MAIRTSNTKVRQLVHGIPDTVNLQPYMDTANALVNYVCLPTGYNEVTDADLLELIERWLSAHFYKVDQPSTFEEEADGVRDRFDSKVDLGLRVTKYGQQAIILDIRGGLAAQDQALSTGGRVRATALWLGRYPRSRVLEVDQE